MRKVPFLFDILLGFSAAALANPVPEGKTIFMNRCAACHNVNKRLTGPALAGVDQRHEMDWIIKFVQSSQTVIKGGDKTAIALYERFNKITMPDHPDLTTDNIKNVVNYIKSESKAGAAVDAPFARPEKLRPQFTPLTIANYDFFLVYVALVVLLIIALLFLVRVKELQRKENTGIIYNSTI
jgi:mono/diheme cytochrome c family protein